MATKKATAAPKPPHPKWFEMAVNDLEIGITHLDATTAKQRRSLKTVFVGLSGIDDATWELVMAVTARRGTAKVDGLPTAVLFIHYAYERVFGLIRAETGGAWTRRPLVETMGPGVVIDLRRAVGAKLLVHVEGMKSGDVTWDRYDGAKITEQRFSAKWIEALSAIADAMMAAR